MAHEPNFILLQGGRFDTANGSNAESLKQIFARFATDRPERLVLYFHGGLVSRQNALEGAGRLAREYKDSGADSLFVIWESGAAEIISQKLEAISQEDIFKRIHLKVSQYVKAKLEQLLNPEGRKGFGLSVELDDKVRREIDKGPEMFGDVSIGDIPPDAVPDPASALTEEEKEEIERGIDRDFTLKQELSAIATSRWPEDSATKSADATAPKTTLMDEEVLREITPPEKAGAKFGLSTILLGKHVVLVVGAVIWRFVKRRDHGPYLTIVEEIMREFYVRAVGRSLWRGMKESIEAAFGCEPDCGGRALVNEMQKLWQSGVTPCVTLIGHSAGAIYVARLLRALDEKMAQDFRANVVLIAPACTFGYLAPALRQGGSRVANLRIFGMGDSIERENSIASVIYPASLLYFVSGVLEDRRDEPLAGMQRFYSEPYLGDGFDDIAFVKDQVTLSRPHGYAWSQVSGFDGANCDMTSHGGWVEAPATLASVKYLIQKGCGNAW